MTTDTPHAATLTPLEVRAQFPLLRDHTYLDVASRAPMGDRVAAALEDHTRVYRTQPLPKQAWLRRVERVRAQLATLVGAGPDEIAFTKSTSDSLNLLGHGLGLRTGDNIVVCPQIEHANNVYPWLHLRERGVELRAVAATGHAFDLERAMAAVDERTRLLSLSSTSFVTGARADLAEVAERCRAAGVFLLVDGVQEVGAMRTDLRALGVDGLGAATQKMLLGCYGLGVLYCRRERLAQMWPPFLTRMGVAWGDGHEADLDEDYELLPGAARFEVGNPNFAGIFALEAALSLLRDVGPATVERHVLELAGGLLRGIADLGVEVLTPSTPGGHAGLVVFRPADPAAVHHGLTEHGITTALRRGAIRASVHVFNDDRDVDRLLDVLARLVRST